jgi:GNAT superfamily N-acetyltransferase
MRRGSAILCRMAKTVERGGPGGPERSYGAGETDLEAFVARHRPALARNEARHTRLLSLLDRRRQPGVPSLAVWSLGEGAACAARSGNHNIVLGDLNEAQCRRLARETAALDYPGVMGPDRTAEWFADEATMLGLVFDEPMPQRIHILTAPPRYPGASGGARAAGIADADLLEAWITAFIAEAVPHDPPMPRAAVERLAASGKVYLWEDDGAPTAMAAIVRETEHCAAISLVYTPPERRGRGYGGSVTAAAVEAVYAAGKTSACLYTDLRNPISNRCYARIGFTPLCASRLYRRLAG